MNSCFSHLRAVASRTSSLKFTFARNMTRFSSAVVEEALQEFDHLVSSQSQRVPLRTVLFRPLIAGVAITGACFAFAAYNEQNFHMNQRLINTVTGRTMARHIESGYPASLSDFIIALRYGILIPGQFEMIGILSSYALVFLAWRLPKFHHFMMRHFLHSTIKVSFNIIHLTEFFEIQRAVFNSIAMFTIGQAVYRKLGPYEFWAVCAGGTTLASIGSILHMIATRRAIAGLGASGVVMMLLAISAFINPEGRYSIIFLPFFEFTGLQALAGVMSLDVLGLLLGWTTFGHAAHLGGALFGIFYVFEGKEMYQRLKRWFSRKGLSKK
eukprot:gene4256-6580_t